MKTTLSPKLAMNPRLPLVLLLFGGILLSSCASRDLRSLRPCVVSANSEQLNILPAEDIDLLFMIDNSGSMQEEQEAIQREIGRMVQTLIDQDEIDALIATSPELEGARAVKRLRVGAVSSDIGVAGFGSNLTGEQVLAILHDPDPDVQLSSYGVVNCGIRIVGGAEAYVDPDRTKWGDKGLINRTPAVTSVPDESGSPVACPESYPDFLFFDVEDDQSISDFAHSVSCTAMLGITGCGFEMQLESVLIAVTPSESEDVTIAEVHGGRGVADLPYPEGNGGFFRDEAILAIIMITDEDDCSTKEPQVFNSSSTELISQDDPMISGLGPLRVNTRCTARYKDAEGNEKQPLYPINRYVDGILAAKPANRLIFAGIVGVPNDGSVDADAQIQGPEAFETLLAHPEMQVREHVRDEGGVKVWDQIPGEPPTSDFVIPACYRCLGDDGQERSIEHFSECNQAGDDLQYAVPADRIVRVAKGLREAGAIALVQTICTDDFSDAVTNILKAIIQQTKPSCLRRALNRDAIGEVPCNFFETLPAGMTCAELEDQGRDPVPYSVSDDGIETCRLLQLVPTEDEIAAGAYPEGEGWFYDDYTVETLEEQCAHLEVKAAVRMSNIQPTPGSQLRIDCLQPTQAEKNVNSPCATDSACAFDDADTLGQFLVDWNLSLDRYSVDGEQPMFCDLESNTCQIGCEASSDCPGSMTCVGDEGRKLCIDPTCSVR